MPSVTPDLIRPLSKTDSISEITRLLHLGYRPLADIGIKFVASSQDDATTLRRLTSGESFVCEHLGKLIATITVIPPQKTHGSPWLDRLDVASFEQFTVHPDYQGNGLGSKMIETAENLAYKWGANEISLDTAEPAIRLIKFYEKRGYRFIEYVQWKTLDCRSVVLSKSIRDV